ncbi:PREDICTED: craniofacial development protein 2-like [Priapulus caudatus]|uniref:Craniofacial development protein 2-like n=1 Tax=Priapulus caudatus TaxID=37621 RepID=A0ABM1ESF1_PRICU|nr:PREDICTED: craniofacial development protein 2-like [Priapulus caudatus]
MFEVRRVSDRIILLRLVVGSSVLTFLSVYAPQVGLSDVVKDQFYDQLRATAAKVPASELLVPCGDWNGHVGRDGTCFREVHGGYGLGVRNVEGDRILEFAVANDVVMGNACFKKRKCHLVTYQSGGISTQINYILFRCNLRKLIVNVKTIPGEECATQHCLLVCDIKVDIPSLPKRKFVPRLKICKLKDPVTRQKFRVAFTQRTVDANAVTTEKWANSKSGLLGATEVVCGQSKKHQWRKQTWWWNDLIVSAVEEKRRCYKAWKRHGQQSCSMLGKMHILLRGF